MKRLLLASLLAACSTDAATEASDATTMPILSDIGPDIIDLTLRCEEDGDAGSNGTQLETSMTLVAASSSSSGTKGSAAIMLGGSRMSFELEWILEHGIFDRLRARAGQEEAMRTACDSPIVTLLDVTLMSHEGTTTVPRIHVVPAWE